MQAVRFAEVLEAALDAVAGPPPSGAWVPPRWSPPPTRLDGPRRVPFASTPYASLVTPAAERPAPPARRLTAAQARALNAMLSRGAALTESFTERELRSAFRLLARQYHPDRHPHASEAARARLARLFGALVADHHTLRTALRPEPTRPH